MHGTELGTGLLRETLKEIMKYLEDLGVNRRYC
jgi:hypothetical protein